MASDAFFPFPDGLEEGIRAGVTAVIQPGGSMKDSDVVAAADAAGIAMVDHRTASFQALIHRPDLALAKRVAGFPMAPYLRIPDLLSLQEGLSAEHDELLFIVAHQVYELWFKVVLDELEAARGRIDSDDIFFARHHLRRVNVIERLLVEQIEVLETMSPQDFLAFRSQLAPASGFQSVQFREIEFLSGLEGAEVPRENRSFIGRDGPAAAPPR